MNIIKEYFTKPQKETGHNQTQIQNESRQRNMGEHGPKILNEIREKQKQVR